MQWISSHIGKNVGNQTVGTEGSAGRWRAPCSLGHVQLWEDSAPLPACSGGSSCFLRGIYAFPIDILWFFSLFLPSNNFRSARCFLFNRTLTTKRYFIGCIVINLVETTFSAGQDSWPSWCLSMTSKPHKSNPDLTYWQSLPDGRVIPLTQDAKKEHCVRILKQLAKNYFSVAYCYWHFLRKHMYTCWMLLHEPTKSFYFKCKQSSLKKKRVEWASGETFFFLHFPSGDYDLGWDFL